MIKALTYTWCLLLMLGFCSACTPDSCNLEQHRPAYHVTPPSQWMNDPNGMVYYDGEYHLFYQHYPDSNVWGPMHWGHAVSTDLLHWKHLPIALYPDSLGYIFSGSAVVDSNNTSGFGRDGKVPLVAIFTHHHAGLEKQQAQDFQYQSIAYSLDKGRTWTKYSGNPVIPNERATRDFRDPKVFWHEPTQRWIMVFAAYDHVQLWGSPDLKQWTFLSDFGQAWGAHTGVWECPDLFELPVENSKETRWVMLVSINPGAPNGGSGTQYFVGEFDGSRFTPDTDFVPKISAGKAVWLDYGRDNYAGVTWSDIPATDGRRIMMGWMSNWDYAQLVPTYTWRSAMTLPRALTLHSTPNGYQLFSFPVTETTKLRTGPGKSISGLSINGEKELISNQSLLELQLTIDLKQSTASQFGLEFSNDLGERYRLGFDKRSNNFFSDRTRSGSGTFSEKFADKLHEAPRILRNDTLQWSIFLDYASAESFADQGSVVLTDIFFPSAPFHRVTVFSAGGQLIISSGNIYSLKTICRH